MTSGFHGLAIADLDEIDHRILEALQIDGRAAVTSIAERVGLSHAATRMRVQRLLEQRVVQVAAITNPATHGYQRSALIGIRSQGDLRAVADAVAAIPEAYYVVISTGTFDVLAELMSRDDAHLLELLGRIRTIPGVVSTESFTFLELVKWEYHPAITTGAEAPPDVS